MTYDLALEVGDGRRWGLSEIFRLENSGRKKVRKVRVEIWPFLRKVDVTKWARKGWRKVEFWKKDTTRGGGGGGIRRGNVLWRFSQPASSLSPQKNQRNLHYSNTCKHIHLYSLLLVNIVVFNFCPQEKFTQIPSRRVFRSQGCLWPFLPIAPLEYSIPESEGTRPEEEREASLSLSVERRDDERAGERCCE